MTDGEALLRAVLMNPSDDDPRLVYADFLDEHGDPPRAEFIRVQVRRAAEGAIGMLPPGQGGPLAARERRLWAGHGRTWGNEFGAWLAPPRATGGPAFMAPEARAWAPKFRRGFPVEVGLFPEAFLAPGAAGRLFDSAPLTEVVLYGRDPELDGVNFGWHLPFD